MGDDEGTVLKPPADAAEQPATPAPPAHEDSHAPTVTQEQRERLLHLYEILFTKFNQEGDGFWGRFNILITIDLAFFGGVALVIGSEGKLKLWREIGQAICVGGLCVTVWSVFVLNRLGQWHDHWRRMLRQIEAAFPTEAGWVKPHWDPAAPSRTRLWTAMSPGLGYAQPLFLILDVAWGLLLVSLRVDYLW